MTTYNWEDVEVPRGAFISWGETTGQHVTGKILSYDDRGGTDFNGNNCPQLAIELIEPAASINKQGQRTDFPAGELVVLNAGQVSLKRAVTAASLNPGDLVKITLENLVQTSNGTVKEYALKVARGAGGNTKPQPTNSDRDPWSQQTKTAASSASEPSAQPPF